MKLNKTHNMAKIMKIIIVVLAVVLLFLVGILVWLEIGHSEKKPQITEASTNGSNLWDSPGAKQPADYSWEEYEALTAAQQTAFQNHLGAAAFDAWLQRVQPTLPNTSENPEPDPWEMPGAKQPAEYIWEEYEALTAAQQTAFQNHLGSAAFDAWLQRVQPTVPNTSENPEPNPWEVPGAKQPADYTWEEFEALTAGQQTAFQNHLGAAAFDAWMKRAQSQPAANPWEAAGAKQPADYTWEEFEALTAGQQTAFQNHLGEAAFDAWLNRVQNQPAANPWDSAGAKQPADYTWEEFEALTVGQQTAFQNHLGEAAFDAWLNRVQNQTAANPWEAPGAKQPADYTWEEFEALTAGQQTAFQSYLGAAAFDAWLSDNFGNE